MPRRAARQDEYHAAVGKLFADDGWDTMDLSQLGEGKPDWLIARGTFAFLLEVKSPQKIRHTRKDDPFTDDQHRFREKWRGPIFAVEDLWGATDLRDLLNRQRVGDALAPKEQARLTLFEFAKEGANP